MKTVSLPTIVCTYDPNATPKLSCTPDKVEIGLGDTGNFAVNLQVIPGKQGTIKFSKEPGTAPITWPNGTPQKITASLNSGDTSVSISNINPNNFPGGKTSYIFNVNYVYTPPAGAGPPIYGSADPTLINEGITYLGDEPGK